MMVVVYLVLLEAHNVLFSMNECCMGIIIEHQQIILSSTKLNCPLSCLHFPEWQSQSSDFNVLRCILFFCYFWIILCYDSHCLNVLALNLSNHFLCSYSSWEFWSCPFLELNTLKGIGILWRPAAKVSNPLPRSKFELQALGTTFLKLPDWPLDDMFASPGRILGPLKVDTICRSVSITSAVLNRRPFQYYHCHSRLQNFESCMQNR